MVGPASAGELYRCHSAVHLVVVEGTSTSLEERLLCGRVDLAAVDVAERDPALRVHRLFDEELLLVVPPDHALAGCHEVDLADLSAASS